MRCQCRVGVWVECAGVVAVGRSEPIICPCDIDPDADGVFNGICLEEISPA